MTRLLPFVLLIATTSLGAAELRLTREQAEKAVLANSPTLAAARFDVKAAERLETSQKSLLFPTLSLDGSYRWVDEVPVMQVAPGRAIQLTDHRSNTVGVGATWQVWDWGSALQAYRSIQAQTESRRAVLRGAGRQALLALRLSYFQVQAASEQTRLIADSLKLSQSQYRDIRARFQAGTASRADTLAAHQEVLSWQRQLRAARGELAASLQDLHAAMGTKSADDLSLPLDLVTASSPPAEIAVASVTVALDPLPDSLARFPAPENAPDATLPQPAQYAALAESARKQQKAGNASLLPKIHLSARASYDYPNGPIFETIQQNTVGLYASMPLFDWGRTRAQSKAAGDQADAWEKRRDQVLSDLGRDWAKTRDLLASLSDQQAFNRQSIAETKELAALAYDSFKNGRASFLEVQSANLRALQAAVLAARTDVQILVQRAYLSALSKED